jgi:hypothetical protein
MMKAKVVRIDSAELDGGKKLHGIGARMGEVWNARKDSRERQIYLKFEGSDQFFPPTPFYESALGVVGLKLDDEVTVDFFPDPIPLLTPSLTPLLTPSLTPSYEDMNDLAEKLATEEVEWELEAEPRAPAAAERLDERDAKGKEPSGD